MSLNKNLVAQTHGIGILTQSLIGVYDFYKFRFGLRRISMSLLHFRSRISTLKLWEALVTSIGRLQDDIGALLDMGK